MPDTGAPWFIPYVENTDLVSDWPTDSLALANAIVAALEDIPVTQKKIAAFTASGTWTVPAGVTYAIAHMVGGGGGANNTGAGNGGASSVAFASGTVTANGGAAHNQSLWETGKAASDGPNNSGAGGTFSGYWAGGTNQINGGVAAASGSRIVTGAAVTPAASVTVTVGAGGTAGTGGAAGGSGYVYIEFSEEV